MQGLKKASFKEVGLVYEALLLLAREYRDMCMGLPREPFEERLQEKGDVARAATRRLAQ